MTLSAPTLRERFARGVNNLLADDGRNAGRVFLDFLRRVANAADDDGRVTVSLSTLARDTVSERRLAGRLVTRARAAGIVRVDEDGAVFLCEPETWADEYRPRDLHPFWTGESSR